MKEIQPQLKDEIVKVPEQKTELKFLGSNKPYRGHTLFKINISTSEIEVADFEVKAIPLKNAKLKNPPVRKKVIVEEGFYYISALNKKNALKKWQNVQKKNY